MRGETRSDPAIAALADRQHGVVSRQQLLDLGVERNAIDRRLSRRSLIPLHRGVYAVGHRQLRIEGRWLAAVLAMGSGAVLSHRDAAALHRMRKPPESRKVSVTTGKDARGTTEMWVYARRPLTDDDVTIVRGIPVTSPARTLVDIAEMLTAAQLQSTLGEADRKGLLDVDGASKDGRRRSRRACARCFRAAAKCDHPPPDPGESARRDRPPHPPPRCPDRIDIRAHSQLMAVQDADRRKARKLSALNDLFKRDFAENGDAEPIFGADGQPARPDARHRSLRRRPLVRLGHCRMRV
jgi:hypothetical protein